MNPQHFVLILGGVVGAVVTFVLQRYGVSAVVASALVGLSGAGLGVLLSDSALPAVIFAGSFVGMTALSVATIPVIVFAGAIAGVLYIASENIFPGYGGKLGTVAFIAVVATIWAAGFLKK